MINILALDTYMLASDRILFQLVMTTLICSRLALSREKLSAVAITTEM